MVVYRLILYCMFITLAAGSYVHQRIEIIKIGYTIEENRSSLSRLVDQNSKLMYNLSKLESPRSLLNSFETEKIKFANQRNSSGENPLIAEAGGHHTGPLESFVGSVIDIFSVKAEAKPRS